MTLVLTALTRHELVQVSDRRFTHLQGGRVVRRDDENNKAVLFCGRLMFSFTGRGDLGIERQTDLWLAQRICDAISAADRPGDQAVVLVGVRDEATELFRKLRYRGQRHAFVAAGWARFDPPAPDVPAQAHEFDPYLALISNFHEAERELPTAAAQFSIVLRRLGPDETAFVFDAPRHLSPDERERLTTQIVAADRVRDVGAIVQALATCVRNVAARDHGVGEGLMISCLPRSALDAERPVMVASSPLASAQTFLYVPPSGDTTVQLGPVATCGAGIVAGFRAGPLVGGWDPAARVAAMGDDAERRLRRWYLVPVVGSGTDADPYRAETLGNGGSAVIPSHDVDHPQHGHPKHDVALVLVRSDDHARLEADARIVPVADLVDLDLPVAELPPRKRGWIERVVEVRGVSVEGCVRDVLQRVGRQLEPSFDEGGFW